MANATALSGRSKIQITLAHEKLDTAKLNKVLDKLNVNVGPDWSFGTGANAANMLYHAKDLTATNAQATVDISGSAISDAFGDACDFAALKLLYIYNSDATEDLELGGDANELDIFKDTSDILLIKPGGFFLWIDPSAAGLDVTTNKNMTIQAETAHVTYDVVLLGEKT